MDHTFLASLPDAPEMTDLEQELRAVAALEREDQRRLAALGFAVEICIAVSAAAGQDAQDESSNPQLLTIAAEGSRAARYGVASGGPQGPIETARILGEMREAARDLAS